MGLVQENAKGDRSRIEGLGDVGALLFGVDEEKERGREKKRCGGGDVVQKIARSFPSLPFPTTGGREALRTLQEVAHRPTESKIQAQTPLRNLRHTTATVRSLRAHQSTHKRKDALPSSLPHTFHS